MNNNRLDEIKKHLTDKEYYGQAISDIRWLVNEVWRLKNALTHCNCPHCEYHNSRSAEEGQISW